MATRIRDRAIRRAGELLTQLNGKGNNQHTADAGPKLTQQQAAQDAGLSPRQQKEAVRIARIPQKDFERQVESPNPPTVSEPILEAVRAKTGCPARAVA